MYTIEPCCARRHLETLRDSIAKGGKTEFCGYGDLSFAELLPAMVIHYCQTGLLVAAPSLPDQAAEALERWMKRRWGRADGKGSMDAISELTVIADLSEEKSPMASVWLKDNPFPGRMRLVDMRQDDTAILLPDFAITGPVNMRYGNPFTATATTDKEEVRALWDRFLALAGKGGKEQRPEEQEAPGAESPEQKPEEEKPSEEAAPGEKEPQDRSQLRRRRPPKR